MSTSITAPVASFKQILHTKDFSEWEAEIKRQLGMHQSHLLSNSEHFDVCCHLAQVGPLHLLHLQGKGELELNRTQLNGGVLWVPLKGVSEERINGRVVQAKRGQAILIRPHDHLYGLTSLEMSGLSVILPEQFFLVADLGASDSSRRMRGQPEPLLRSELAIDQAVIALTMQLSRAAAHRDPASPILAAQLLDQLEEKVTATPSPSPRIRQSLGARRRWEVAQEAIASAEN